MKRKGVLFLKLALFGVFFLIFSCGKKAPPQPPLEKESSKTSALVKNHTLGEGGYLISRNGIALYWSFPIEVDYSRILICVDSETIKNCKVIAPKVYTYSFLIPGKIERKTVFRVLGIKGGETVAEAIIKVNP